MAENDLEFPITLSSSDRITGLCRRQNQGLCARETSALSTKLHPQPGREECRLGHLFSSSSTAVVSRACLASVYLQTDAVHTGETARNCWEQTPLGERFAGARSTTQFPHRQWGKSLAQIFTSHLNKQSPQTPALDPKPPHLLLSQ